MATYYILVNSAGVYVKDHKTFSDGGGHSQPWGSAWELIDAESLYAARNEGIRRRRERYPASHKTMGEDGEAPESYWPEARGA